MTLPECFVLSAIALGVFLLKDVHTIPHSAASLPQVSEGTSQGMFEGASEQKNLLQTTGGNSKHIPKISRKKSRKKPKNTTVSQKITSIQTLEPGAKRQRGLWSYVWQILYQSPLPERNESFTAYSRRILQEKVDFRLGSPYRWPLGSLQIRGQLPLNHLLSQLGQTAETKVPDSIQKNLSMTFADTSLYGSWRLPFQSAAYLQVGSIRVHSASPWYALRSSLKFPKSKDSIRIMPVGENLQPSPYLQYESESGLGKNWGLSWDSRWLHLLFLHQRNSYLEYLGTGLAWSWQYKSSQNKKMQGYSERKAQNVYLLRAAVLFSQSLSRPTAEQGRIGTWYLFHTKKQQNSSLYAAGTAMRWAQLLRYDQAVKQFYFHGSWGYTGKRPAKGKKTKNVLTKPPYIHLSSEQSISVSPLDYWGSQQKYYAFLQVPLWSDQRLKQSGQSTEQRKLVLNSELLATYTDSNWIDSRRILANSNVAQVYGNRLGLEEQVSLHWQRKQNFIRQAQAIKNLSNKNLGKKGLTEELIMGSSQNILRNKRRDQILKITVRADTARFLHQAQQSYWNLAGSYYLFWTKSYPQSLAESKWVLFLHVRLRQDHLSSEKLQYDWTALPHPLWQRDLQLGLGWQQPPPSRIPQGSQNTGNAPKGKNIATRTTGITIEKEAITPVLRRNTVYSLPHFGWKGSIQVSEEQLGDAQILSWNHWQGYFNKSQNLENLQGSLQLQFFFQVWKYGQILRMGKGRSKGWWKFFQLQLHLRIDLQFRVTLGRNVAIAQVSFQVKFQFQLRQGWQFELGMMLDHWDLEQTLSDSIPTLASESLYRKLSIRLSVRYRFYGNRTISRESQQAESRKIDLAEQFDKPFQLEDPEESEESENEEALD